MGYEPVVITSGSMRPAIDVGDVVVTAPSDGRVLGEGAVVNFEAEDRTRLHRIVEVTMTGYRTAGDANADADSDLVALRGCSGWARCWCPSPGFPASGSSTGAGPGSPWRWRS